MADATPAKDTTTTKTAAAPAPAPTPAEAEAQRIYDERLAHEEEYATLAARTAEKAAAARFRAVTADE